MRYRLVATDLDGTLLTTAMSASRDIVERDVADHVRDLLRRVQEAGVLIVPVTARAPRSVVPIASAFGIRGYAICGSGSLVYDLDREEQLDEHVLQAEVAARLVEGLRAAHPGVVFAAERNLQWVREPAYGNPVLPIPGDISEEDALSMVRSGVTKLVAKHPTLGQDVLMHAARQVLGDAAHVGHAGAGVHIEILAAGATKAATLERLCARLGISSSEVVAFGDYEIDIPMLVWAGLGVAPSNAADDVRAAADDTCGSCDEDGVVRYLDVLLRAGRLG